jgi:hypothetical protein
MRACRGSEGGNVFVGLKAGWTKETIEVIDAQPTGDGSWALVNYDLAGTGEVDGKKIGGYAVQVLKHEGTDWRFSMLIGNLRPTQDVTGMATVKVKP